jgi:hypothetical protein
MFSSPGTSAFSGVRPYGGNRNKFSSLQISVAAACLPLTLLAYFPYFEKKNKSRFMRSPYCLCIHRPLNFSMPELIFMKLGIYNPNGKLINPSYRSLRLYVCARQRLGKIATAATNTHAKLEELLDASFYMRSVSCKRKMGD